MQAADPLELGVALPLRDVFYPSGFALEIETNSPLVLDAARESWPGGSAIFTAPPLQVRAVIKGEVQELPPPPAFRGQGHLLTIISDQKNFAVCDYLRGFAFCRLEPTPRDWMRFHFLEAAVYLLLTHLYVTPVHAAAVALDGRGVLLAGDSGDGKSCLAYACACRGWTYLADDASSLVRGRGDRLVVGRPHQIRFRDSAAALFPELAGRPAVYGMNGKRSIEVPTLELPHIATAGSCLAEYLVFLDRREGPAALAPLPAAVARGRLEDALFLYDAPVREAQLNSLAELVSAQAFDLHYQEPAGAELVLRSLVRDGGRL